MSAPELPWDPDSAAFPCDAPDPRTGTPVRWWLESHTLCGKWAGGGVLRVPYADVKTLWLDGASTYRMTRLATLEVHTARDGVLKIPSAFAGPVQPSPRLATWLPFVRELHRRVAAANPALVCTQGTPRHVRVLFSLLAGPFIAAFALFSVLSLRDMDMVTIVSCAATVMMGAPFAYFLHVGRMQPYDPHAPPLGEIEKG